MYNVDRVFIVTVNVERNGTIDGIESVWSSEALARAAIHLHAEMNRMNIGDFDIVERRINTANKRSADNG